LRESLRLIILVFILSVLVTNITMVYAVTYTAFTADPEEGPARTYDIIAEAYGNDGTYLYFKVQFELAKTTSSDDLHIFLDVGWTTGGDANHVNADYALDTGTIPASGSWTGTFYYWTGAAWASDGSKTVSAYYTTGLTDTIEVYVKLSDIGYDPAGSGDMGVSFWSYDTAYLPGDTANVDDKAPDAGVYTVSHAVIPELPWPMPLVFIPAVVATVYILYRRRFRQYWPRM